MDLEGELSPVKHKLVTLEPKPHWQDPREVNPGHWQAVIPWICHFQVIQVSVLQVRLNASTKCSQNPGDAIPDSVPAFCSLPTLGGVPPVTYRLQMVAKSLRAGVSQN